MFSLKNISKYFRRTPQHVEYAPVTEEELDNGWIVLGTDPEEDDFILVSETEHAKQLSIQKMAIDLEIIAKSEAYKLSVPLEAHPDKALAAEKRLENQGYKVYNLGSDAARSKGVFLYALVNEANTQSPITVVCRGTQLDASIIADLDPSGPGRAIMQQEQANILEQLNELSGRYPNRAIRLTGHSLGGSLAQTLTTFILEEIRNGLQGTSQYKALGAITGVDTVVFQSAGVSQELAQQAKEYAEFIKSANEDFEMNFVAHVKKGDFVSRTGTYLFSDIDNKVVDVSLVLRELDKPCMTLGNYLDVGFAGVTAGPVGVLTSLIHNMARNYVRNRLQAHSDFFHHDKDHVLLPESFGMCRNEHSKDRALIKEVFEENIVTHIPGSARIQSALHRMLDGLTSEELWGMGACLGGAATLANAAMVTAGAVSSANPLKIASVVGRQIPVVSKTVASLTEHHEAGQRGLLNLFSFWSPEKPTSEESTPASSCSVARAC